ncbi:ABC transporter ATP-binding protein [Mesorhizobium sp. GR13]|uniref:ABC transporter ATP-binding protein n=1 Tax=Mesorhizobium sp. GR13 TaxID=2562308 RepID=UPI0010BF9134|nr:ABC transporter ATP-binding protein [Mesorhizobium sp. GR13]
MLRLEGLTVDYGPVRAVHGLDLAVAAGELVTLLGPNGAGKSSTIGAITGLVPSGGRIVFDGAELGRVSPEVRVERGIAASPEGRHIFANLTVAENLRLGAATRKNAVEVRSDMERFLALFPVLAERITQPAGTLSGGEQQMLAIARALMSRPKLLLLDEPSLGLAPMIVARIFDFIGQLKAEGMTILLVEQNAAQAMRVADRVYVMSTGEVSFTGPASALAGSDLMALYLGS